MEDDNTQKVLKEAQKNLAKESVKIRVGMKRLFEWSKGTEDRRKTVKRFEGFLRSEMSTKR